MPSPLAVCELKRRERRAPLRRQSRNPILRTSISHCQPTPALDKPRHIGQSRAVETPPVLNPPTAATKPKRKRRKKLFIIIALVLVALGVTLYFALRKTDPAISVTTEKVSRHNITETVVANGRIYPVLQVHISAGVGWQ